jgi:hypothetical protein
VHEKNWGTVEGRNRIRFRLKLAKKISPQFPFERKSIPIIPSLSLQTVMQTLSYNLPERYVDAVFDPKQGEILLRDKLKNTVKSFAVEDDRMEIIVNVIDRIHFNKRRYSEVYRNLSDRNLLLDYTGKIVVIGYETEEDKHGGRFGVEIQASAISNLFTGGYFEPLGRSYHYLVITLMIVIGVLANTRFRRWMRFKIPFSIPVIDKPLEVPLSLLVIIAFYFFIAFILYKEWSIILNFNYHILALFLGYFIVGRLKKGITLQKTVKT